MSALITINNLNVYSLDANMPLDGAWTADLEVNDVQNTLTEGTAVGINISGGVLSGTVAKNRTGSFINTVYCRVVGGKNKLGNTAKPRQFKNARVQDVIRYLLSQAQETLSSTSNIENSSLSFYTVSGDVISKELYKLLQTLGPDIHWRFLPDGTMFIGTETWPSAPTDGYTFMESQPHANIWYLGVPFPTLIPGTNLHGIGNISRVTHKVNSKEGGRTTVYAEINAVRGVKDSIRGIIENMFNFNYLAMYLCKVVSQANNLVDIIPENKKFPGLQGVELTTGNLESMIGQKVLLFWDGGDPASPRAMPAWSNQSTAKLVVLDKDKSDCGSLSLSANTAGVTLTYTDPVSHATIVSPPTPIPLRGVITSSATKIKGV